MAIANETFYSIKGSSDIIPQPDKREWNLTDGVSTYKVFAGTVDAIQRKFNELAAAGSSSGVDDIQEEINGRAGKLVCRVVDDSGGAGGGNTEEVNAVWELRVVKLLKPIESHSFFRTAITPERKRDIENYVKDKTNYPLAPALANATEKKLAGYYADQILDYEVWEFELYKSIVVSDRTLLTLSYVNSNNVVVLGTGNFNPPAAILGVMTSLPKMDGTSGAWEWKKNTPQLRSIGKRKFHMEYSWHGAEKWADIYSGGSYVPTYA